jgi:hypothetical protein
MSLFIDLFQQQQIQDARRKAENASEKASDMRAVLDDFARRVEALALANQALFEILRERTGITDDEVLARMQQIDLRDGTKDGRMGGKPTTCPRCGRRANTVRKHCIYCGARLTGGHLFGR